MSKPKSEFVQDFIPVKDIRHGIIETTDGRYIKILEIEPINFMLRSDEEQFGIISSFANWLKISPMRMQFKSVTRKADSEKHIAMLREEIKREETGLVLFGRGVCENLWTPEERPHTTQTRACARSDQSLSLTCVRKLRSRQAASVWSVVFSS